MLRELQQAFVSGLYRRDAAAPILGAIDDARRPAEDQLRIYRESILGGLVDALGEIYPVCRGLVGERFFDAMARRHVEAHRSLSPDLTDYGEDFAGFVAGFAPAQSLPYLADVAHLEWRWHRVFNSPDVAPFDLSRLARLEEAQHTAIVWRLAPEAGLLQSQFPVDRIWQANQPQQHEVPLVNLEEGAVQLFVWRQGLTMRIERVSDTERLFLQVVADALPFGELCEGMASAVPGVDPGALLVRAIEAGQIVSFDLAASDAGDAAS
ncbi:MAG: putative DNA-binding domain-containing protein [Pseudomonadota bacterium]|nr:MAG: putative DNA-binding domain-containing protein [Pseudomonadota bacterium]